MLNNEQKNNEVAINKLKTESSSIIEVLFDPRPLSLQGGGFKFNVLLV